jgi:hypothetical protein
LRCSARLDLAETQRTPDVNLELRYRLVGGIDSVDNTVDVGVHLPIPLFDPS